MAEVVFIASKIYVNDFEKAVRNFKINLIKKQTCVCTLIPSLITAVDFISLT